MGRFGDAEVKGEWGGQSCIVKDLAIENIGNYSCKGVSEIVVKTCTCVKRSIRKGATSKG